VYLIFIVQVFNVIHLIDSNILILNLIKQVKISSFQIFQVQKYGYPNGVIGFYDVSLATRIFDEPSARSLTVVFPITRTRGTAGDIRVHVMY